MKKINPISDEGLKRIATFIQGQAWSGDVLTLIQRSDYYMPGESLTTEGNANTVGSVFDFSDGARRYVDHPTGAILIVLPDGNTLTDDSPEAGIYSDALREYSGYEPLVVMDEAAQADFNSVMSTDYPVGTMNEQQQQETMEDRERSIMETY